MTDYASILRNLGYKLTDRGNYWQTAALFRDGDNKTAISIYKDSGVWTDFVEGRSFPFEVLLKKTLKTNDVDHLIENKNFNFTTSKRELLKEEKTYPAESLKKLLPDYDYFKDRGIYEETQIKYKGGLATSGKLYQRFIFPIFREDGKIHGFHGRKVLQDNDRPKWLPYGRIGDWFYPYWSVEDVKEECEKEKRIFIVESIGDSMALYQSGIKNNCVAFTNNLSKKLISKLVATGYDLVFSLNNDSEGQNRGFDGAINSILKLIDVVDLQKIWFAPPPEGDFGNLIQKDGEIEKWRSGITFDTKIHQEMCQKILDYLPEAKIQKTLAPKIKKLKREVKFLHE